MKRGRREAARGGGVDGESVKVQLHSTRKIHIGLRRGLGIPAYGKTVVARSNVRFDEIRRDDSI